MKIIKYALIAAAFLLVGYNSIEIKPLDQVKKAGQKFNATAYARDYLTKIKQSGNNKAVEIRELVSMLELNKIKTFVFFPCNSNTEKRKERSRDAARSRRSKEAEYFSDLAASLPHPENLAGHVDKASIMRLSITYLKLKSFVDSALAGSSTEFPFDSRLLGGQELDHTSALVGLLFVVSKDGEIIFVSDNVIRNMRST